MKHTKRAVSIVLVLSMIIAMFAMCVTSTSAADPDDVPLLGDVDRNGVVQLYDALLIQRSLAYKNGSINYDGMTNADIEFRIANTCKRTDYDREHITLLDVTYIQFYVAKSHKVDGLGIGEPIDMPEDPTQPATQPATQAPTQPATQRPTQPATQPATQRPTQPATQPATQAPTQPATAPADKASVTLYNNGVEYETAYFSVGETFTVYTILNTSEIDDGKISTVAGEQLYTYTILSRADELDEEDLIVEVEDVFPVMGDKAMGNGMDEGALYFSGTNPSKKKPFIFNTDSSKLLVTQYTVTGLGEAKIDTDLKTLALTDDHLTKVVDKYKVQGDYSFTYFSTFTDNGEVPTQAPTQPATQAPTQPATQRPTQPATQAPTQPATQRPTQPATQAPTQPATQRPTQPATQAPTQPATQRPTQPATQAPTQPATQKPTQPATQAPTQPATQKPTQPATQAPTTAPEGKAVVTLIAADNTYETKTFNVGDEFKVYTILNTANIDDGKISTVAGEQYYTTSVLTLTDELDDESLIVETEDVFPVMGDKAMGNGETSGELYFSGTNPSKKKPFIFNTDSSKLVVTTYKVAAAGEATVRTMIKTLALTDDYLTKVVNNYIVQSGYSFTFFSTFTDSGLAPTQPATQAPTQPATQAPTQPATQAPTQPATQAPTQPATQAPTTAPEGKAVVTLIAADNTYETKTFNVGDEFAVYTILNTAGIDDGKISTVAGEQYYTTSVLTLTDELDEESLIVETDDVFPVMGDKAMGNGETSGELYFSGTNPSKRKPFVFNTDSSKLVVTTYKVAAAGEATVKTLIKTMALTDDYLTKVVDKYIVQGDYSFTFFSTFTDSGVVPTSAPTQPATQAPTQPATQKPTQPATQAPTQPATQAPTQPATQKPTQPATQAPTQPATQKPTQPETQAPTTAPEGKAVVTLIAADNTYETKTFNVGDEFKVYTILNTANIDDGKISTVAGEQYYTTSVLALTDELDDESLIVETDDVFPVMGDKAMGNGETSGELYFSGTNPSKRKPFIFNTDSSKLVVTTYKVAAAGEATVKTLIKTMALTDDYLTKVVDKYIVQGDYSFTFFSTFTDSGVVPTSAPTQPATQAPTQPATQKPTQPATQAPTQPTTQAPTQPATQKPTQPATQAPTQPATQAPTQPETQAPTTAPEGKAVVTLIAADNTYETKTFNVGDEFKVYTILNTANIDDGKISTVAGEQYYTTSVLALTDELDDESLIVETDDVFPVMGDKAMGNAETTGELYFSGTNPSKRKPFVFNTDSSKLVVTTYKVAAAGEATVKTMIKTMALTDDYLTKVVDKYIVQGDYSFTFFSTFTDSGLAPTQPATQAPTQPATQAPTQPATQAPTQPATQAPTQPATQAPTQPATQAPTQPATQAPDLSGFYIAGSMNDWAPNAAYKLSLNTAASAEEYYLEGLTLSTTDQFKVAYSADGATFDDNAWYPDGMGNNYGENGEITAAGTYTVYFRPNSDGDAGWFNGCIYIDMPAPETQAPTTASDTITVYFTDALGWGSINVYYWNNGPDWPGTPATAYEVNDYNQQVYSAVIPADVTGVIFNGGGKQTVDITTGITDGAQWYTTGAKSGNNYEVEKVGEVTPTQPATQAPTTASNTTLTLNPGMWDKDGARFAAYFFGNGDTWVNMTAGANGTYTVEVPDGYTSVIFCRMNGSTTENSWGNKWNQTGDLTVSEGIGKVYNISGWDNSGYWS